MLSKSTVLIAQTLFSRCLENELKPDKLQFTKFLYLIDYCNYRFRGEKATDIDWLFFHYGPWASEMPNIMQEVMDRFPVGWVDRTEEYEGYMPRFDPVRERLDFTLEGIVSRVVQAFKSRTTNDVIEWCYKQTEPMRAANRGEHLDFNAITVNKEMPEFFPKPKTWDMPQSPARLLAKRNEHKERMRKLRPKFAQYKENLESPVYVEAMAILADNNRAEMPNLDNAEITWDREVVDSLSCNDE